MTTRGYSFLERSEQSIDKMIWIDVVEKLTQEFKITKEQLKLILAWVYECGEYGGMNLEAMLELPMNEVKKSIRRNTHKLHLIPRWLQKRTNNLWNDNVLDLKPLLGGKRNV